MFGGGMMPRGKLTLAVVVVQCVDSASVTHNAPSRDVNAPAHAVHSDIN